MVSVTKDESLGWEMIVQQLRTYITEWLMEHPEAVEEAKLEDAVASLGQRPSEGTDAPSNDVFNRRGVHRPERRRTHEHDDTIKQLLEEFVRPAVEQDGGAIDFVAFKEGTVYVHLRGHVLDVRRRPKP